jgi:signal transduction histidine kinase
MGRWLALLVMTRVLGATVAVALLALHEVSDYDSALIAVAILWTATSLGAFWSSPRLQRAPAAWVVDTAAALLLVWLSTDWRSPFYVFALTTLVLPATTLRFRPAVVWGLGFTVGYVLTAIATERVEGTFERAISLEVSATHLMVPIMIVLALAYASEVLRQLRSERARGERLALEAERQRIAWELHDSAKQRLHAAHLLMTALDGRLGADERETLGHALGELRSATAEMDTAVGELQSPIDGRPVDDLLRERAAELGRVSPALIVVEGDLPELPPLVATHTYRIASEALTNAIRHSRAERIEVSMRHDADRAVIEVRDDGIGLPKRERPGSHGLPSMRSRAATIGAELELQSESSGGTTMTLDLPLSTRQGALA